MQIKPEQTAPVTPQPEAEKPKPEPTPTPAVKPAAPDKNKIILIAAVIVGILVISLVLYFVFRRPVEVEVEPIAIANLLLASSIDAEYNYVEREGSTYTKGEIITIYHEVQNIRPVNLNGGYQISFEEVHKLFDPDTQPISFITEENSYSTTRTVDFPDILLIKLSSLVDTSRLTKLGTYTYRITLADQVKEIKFSLES